jgi:hypothetical protein
MVENNEFDIDLTPKTYKQAMNSNNLHHWQEDINKELKSIADNKVFSVVPRPDGGVKLQSGGFLFKIKYTGNIAVYKARLIAHGFKQIAGFDYYTGKYMLLSPPAYLHAYFSNYVSYI